MEKKRMKIMESGVMCRKKVRKEMVFRYPCSNSGGIRRCCEGSHGSTRGPDITGGDLI